MVFRFEQFVQMHDEIFHLCIVHRPLRIGAPGLFGCRISRKYADDVELAYILEIQAARVFDPAAEHEVEPGMGESVF